MNLKKILDTLATLQEGLIEEMKLEDGNLNLKVECSHLADLINTSFSYFYIVLKNTKDVYFHPWDEEETTITSIREIQLLKPDILNIEKTETDYIKIYSNCLNVYSGGNLYVLADDIRIFDEDLKEMTLAELEELSDKYWLSANKAEG
jgi:hypothetical protein